MTNNNTKLLRILQIMQTTNESEPLNAVQINEKLENEFGLDRTERKSIYKYIESIIECGYPVVKTNEGRKGWYYEKNRGECLRKIANIV